MQKISAIHSFDNILSKVIFYVKYLYKIYLKWSCKHLLVFLRMCLYVNSVSVHFILPPSIKSFLHCSAICVENWGSGSNINWMPSVKLHMNYFKRRTRVIEQEFSKNSLRSVITGKSRKMTLILPSNKKAQKIQKFIILQVSFFC